MKGCKTLPGSGDRNYKKQDFLFEILKKKKMGVY